MNKTVRLTICFLAIITWASMAFAQPITAYNHCFNVGKSQFNTELALTSQQKTIGMMHRKKIEVNQAMLFAFNSPIKASFWMKNTLIPLDILYFDKHLILKQIIDNAQPCKKRLCPTYESQNSDIQYVLEIKGGESIKQDVSVGDKLSECEYSK